MHTSQTGARCEPGSCRSLNFTFPSSRVVVKEGAPNVFADYNSYWVVHSGSLEFDTQSMMIGSRIVDNQMKGRFDSSRETIMSMNQPTLGFGFPYEVELSIHYFKFYQQRY